MPKYTVDSLRKKLQFLRKVRGSFVGSSMFVHTQAERGEAFSQTIHAITTQVFNSMNPLFKGVSFEFCAASTHPTITTNLNNKNLVLGDFPL